MSFEIRREEAVLEKKVFLAHVRGKIMIGRQHCRTMEIHTSAMGKEPNVKLS